MALLQVLLLQVLLLQRVRNARASRQKCVKSLHLRMQTFQKLLLAQVLVRERGKNSARNRSSNKLCSQVAKFLFYILQHVQCALSHLLNVTLQIF
jgi:hypothetical protein